MNQGIELQGRRKHDSHFIPLQVAVITEKNSRIDALNQTTNMMNPFRRGFDVVEFRMVNVKTKLERSTSYVI
jgi:hypothetical protein